MTSLKRQKLFFEYIDLKTILIAGKNTFLSFKDHLSLFKEKQFGCLNPYIL